MLPFDTDHVTGRAPGRPEPAPAASACRADRSDADRSDADRSDADRSDRCCVDGCLDDVDVALRAAVGRYYAGHGPADPALRAAVGAAVAALRADGRDVVTVLRTVRDRLGARGAPPGRLLDDAVRWCIARYYDEAGATRRPAAPPDAP